MHCQDYSIEPTIPTLVGVSNVSKYDENYFIYRNVQNLLQVWVGQIFIFYSYKLYIYKRFPLILQEKIVYVPKKEKLLIYYIILYYPDVIKIVLKYNIHY